MAGTGGLATKAAAAKSRVFKKLPGQAVSNAQKQYIYQDQCKLLQTPELQACCCTVILWWVFEPGPKTPASHNNQVLTFLLKLVWPDINLHKYMSVDDFEEPTSERLVTAIG